MVDEDHQRAGLLGDAADDLAEPLASPRREGRRPARRATRAGACRRRPGRPRRAGAGRRRACRPARFATSPRPTNAIASITCWRRARRDPPSVCSWTRSTFSYTERFAIACSVWNVRRTPHRARRKSAMASRSSPKAATTPAIGRTNPLSTLKNVVLPAPFGPMSPHVPAGERDASSGRAARRRRTAPSARRPRSRVGSRLARPAASTRLGPIALAPEVLAEVLAAPARRCRRAR